MASDPGGNATNLSPVAGNLYRRSLTARQSARSALWFDIVRLLPAPRIPPRSLLIEKQAGAVLAGMSCRPCAAASETVCLVGALDVVTMTRSKAMVPSDIWLLRCPTRETGAFVA